MQPLYPYMKEARIVGRGLAPLRRAAPSSSGHRTTITPERRREGFHAPPIRINPRTVDIKRGERNGKEVPQIHALHNLWVQAATGWISRREGFYAPPVCHALTFNSQVYPVHLLLASIYLYDSRSCRGTPEGRKTPPYVIFPHRQDNLVIHKNYHIKR